MRGLGDGKGDTGGGTNGLGDGGGKSGGKAGGSGQVMILSVLDTQFPYKSQSFKFDVSTQS